MGKRDASDEKLVERDPHEAKQSQRQRQRLPKDGAKRRRENLVRGGERVLKHDQPLMCGASLDLCFVAFS
jgi:hypothetical protein